MKHGGDIYRNKVNMDFSVNLNPAGTPRLVTEALRRAVDMVQVYPDIQQQKVREILAAAHGLSRRCVCAANGASQLLMSAARAVAPSKALLYEPCFSGYRHVLSATGCRVEQHLLSEEKGFALTREDLEAIKDDIDLIFVCDPANPTGLNVQDEILKELLEKAGDCRAAVILDESFYLMSDKGDMGLPDKSRELLDKYPGLFIIRSLTKILSIPGVRTGYAISSPANINALFRQLPEWNLSTAGEEAVKAGIKVITETEFVAETLRMIKKERSFLCGRLTKMGFTVFESNSAYILFKGPGHLYEELLKKGILIRDCSDYTGLSKGFYRIAVKDHESNLILTDALREITDGV